MTNIQASKQIKALYLAYHRWLYPDFPEYARTYPSWATQLSTTNGLTRAVRARFLLDGWMCRRISTGGRMIDNRTRYEDVCGRTREIGSVQWIKGTSQVGQADLTASVNGVNWEIEIKNKKTKDRKSKAQDAYGVMTTISGGNYIVIGTFEEFMDWYSFPENPRKIEFWEMIRDSRDNKGDRIITI